MSWIELEMHILQKKSYVSEAHDNRTSGREFCLFLFSLKQMDIVYTEKYGTQLFIYN